MKNSEVVVVNGVLMAVIGGIVIVNSVKVTGGVVSGYSQMVTARSADCTFVNSSFIGDTSGSPLAGFIFESCTVRMGGVNISHMNSPVGGGGLDVTSCTVSLQNCMFKKNQGAEGGAMAASSSTVTIGNSIFDANFCNGQNCSGGGGFFLSVATSIFNTFFTNNYASYGGAFTTYGNPTSTGIHKLINC